MNLHLGLKIAAEPEAEHGVVEIFFSRRERILVHVMHRHVTQNSTATITVGRGIGVFQRGKDFEDSADCAIFQSSFACRNGSSKCKHQRVRMIAGELGGAGAVGVQLARERLLQHHAVTGADEHGLLFYDRVEALARTLNEPTYAVLGPAMVHEIGHVYARRGRTYERTPAEIRRSAPIVGAAAHIGLLRASALSGVEDPAPFVPQRLVLRQIVTNRQDNGSTELPNSLVVTKHLAIANQRVPIYLRQLAGSKVKSRATFRA